MKRVLALLFFCTAVLLTACKPITEPPDQNTADSPSSVPHIVTSDPVIPTPVPDIVTSNPATLHAINLTKEGSFLVSDQLKAHLSFRPHPDAPGLVIPILKFWYPSNVNSEYDEPTLTYDTGMGVVNSTNEQFRCSSLQSDISCFILQIVELDNTNQAPEVLFSEYSGGAHCCTTITIFYQDKHAIWQSTQLDWLDGYPVGATTIDSIDDYVIITRDQSFPYYFDSYANSLVPSRVYALESGKLVDISDHNRLVPYFKAQASLIEQTFLQSSPPESNGFWAGYVAIKARADEFDDGWEKMLTHYDRDSIWGLDETNTDQTPTGRFVDGVMEGMRQLKECPSSDDKLSNCQVPQHFESFPEALMAFLTKTGYIN
jgi:hypothetical protein